MGTSDGSIIGTTKIVDHGLSADRWNLVILGDGYQASELTKYHTDVDGFVQQMQFTPPFGDVWSAINIYRVDVTSTDSGADDPASCGGTGNIAATYFDASFCNNNIRRLLLVNTGTALSVAISQVPEMHQTLVIVNSAIYGGAGGTIAVFSMASSASEIALHELGHSAFGLADEYEYFRGCGSGETDRNKYTGPEPVEPNVTKDTDRSTLKWRDFVFTTTPLPTTENADCTRCDPQFNPQQTDTVGTYEGARYFHCDLYRPQFNCKMRTLGQPFCAVCQQAIREMLKPFTPSTTLPTLQIEAEAGQRVGAFVIGTDSAASGGQYVYVPGGTGNRTGGPDEAQKVDYTFQVAQAGTYRIKGWVHAASGENDSFWVKVNGAPAGGYLWDTLRTTSYEADYVNHRGGADPVEVTLAAGLNTVTVYLREDGTRLDKLELEQVGSLVQEAEAGERIGAFVIGTDSAASGGQYVHVPNGTGDRHGGPDEAQKVDYTFQVAQAGTYRIKGWVHAASGEDDSFWVKVNGAPAGGYLWDTLRTTSYEADYVNHRGGADPVEVTLAAGINTVTVYLREDGTRLDKLELEHVGSLVQEAEAGERVGAFVIGTDSAASGGQYVYVPNGTGDRHGGPDETQKVDYTFQVAQAGTYRIKGWVHAASGEDDSFWVKVNGAPAGGYLWDTLRTTSYEADYVNHRGGADPVEVTLAAGINTVTVYLREDGTRLDKLELERVGA